jgi:hypothetical protein
MERPEQKVARPQVGSMRRTSLRPKTAMAGSRVRSRINSSTNSGVWRRAKRLRASSESSWYRSPKKRVFHVGSVKSCTSSPVSGTTWRQKAIRSLAASPEMP